MSQQANTPTPVSSPSYTTAMRRGPAPRLPWDVMDLVLTHLDKHALAKMALVSRCFTDRALSLLWMELDNAEPLLALLRPPFRPSHYTSLNSVRIYMTVNYWALISEHVQLNEGGINKIMERWMFYAKRVHRLILNEVTIDKQERDILLRRHDYTPLLPELRVLLISDDSGGDPFGLGRWDQDTYMAEHMVILFLSPSLKKLAISVNYTWSLDWGKIKSRCPNVEDLCIGFPTSSFLYFRPDRGVSIDYDPDHHVRNEERWGYRITKHGKSRPSPTPALRDSICQWASLTKLGITGGYEPLPALLHSIAKLPSLAYLTIFDPQAEDDWLEVRSNTPGDGFLNLHQLSLRPATPSAALRVFSWPGLLYHAVRLRWDLFSDDIADDGFSDVVQAIGENARCLRNLELHEELSTGQPSSEHWKEKVQELFVSGLGVSCPALVFIPDS